MKYWTRTTHNFNNETREWEDVDFKGEYFDLKHQKSLGVHALDCGRWRNLDEIIKENNAYCDCWPDAYRATEKEILDDLNLLENYGLVKSKSI